MNAMMRTLLFVGTAIGPAILLAVVAIGQLRDPFPAAALFSDSLGSSLQTGFAVARAVGILELCLAMSLGALLGRSRVPARLGIVGLLPLVLILWQVLQQPP